MIKHEILAGTTIKEAAKEICSIATRKEVSVSAEFNGITIIAHPGDSFDSVVEYYWSESKRKQAEYEASPECKQRQIEAAQRQAEKEKAFAEATNGAPEEMSFSDRAIWQSWINVNKDPYGKACVDYAHVWARIMEKRIAAGERVADIMDETSHVADTEGITSFMYGCAVGMLSKAWKYGEELRIAHNLKTQIKDEGEKANLGGGVLNPALLCVGK